METAASEGSITSVGLKSRMLWWAWGHWVFVGPIRKMSWTQGRWRARRSDPPEPSVVTTLSDHHDLLRVVRSALDNSIYVLRARKKLALEEQMAWISNSWFRTNHERARKRKLRIGQRKQSFEKGERNLLRTAPGAKEAASKRARVQQGQAERFTVVRLGQGLRGKNHQATPLPGATWRLGSASGVLSRPLLEFKMQLGLAKKTVEWDVWVSPPDFHCKALLLIHQLKTWPSVSFWVRQPVAVLTLHVQSLIPRCWDFSQKGRVSCTQKLTYWFLYSMQTNITPVRNCSACYFLILVSLCSEF